MRDRIAVVQADVAGPLRAGAFDFVVANPPWVAAPDLDETGQPCVYADGGPTGFELPRRFLHDAARLLRPGGVAVVCCLDRRPPGDEPTPLDDTVADLRARPLDVEVIPTSPRPGEPAPAPTTDARDPPTVRHVAVVVRRPR